MKYIDTFWCVTANSVYRVTAIEPWVAEVRKIMGALRSSTPIGTDISRGKMVAICSMLCIYDPALYAPHYRIVGYERKFEFADRAAHGKITTRITALFRTRDEAFACFKAPNLEPCDRRWLESTWETVEAIGDDHPSFYVSRDPNLGLIEWALVKFP